MAKNTEDTIEQQGVDETAAPCCSPKSTEIAESTATDSGCCPPVEASSCCPPSEESSSCCPPTESSGCCPPTPNHNRPGYSLCSYVTDWLSVNGTDVPVVATRLSWRDRFSRWALRWNIGRSSFQISPGLYAIGNPTADSAVFVSANYRMSFDYLRSSLKRQNCWILVIDTKGINVWCAAGKGTFGTDEIVKRIAAVGLEKVVDHRQLIVPQLGAPGVAAHRVKKESGFAVIYGPVKAQDLPDFIDAGMKATPSMRQIGFTTWERVVLTPVELIVIWRHLGYFLLLLLVLATIGDHFFTLTEILKRFGGALLFTLLGVISGTLVAPTLLPMLPGRMFAIKGAITGVATAIAAVGTLYHLLSPQSAIAGALLIISVSSYGMMNFTGTSTFTSPSGVEKEMRISIPFQLLAMIIAIVLWIRDAF